MSHLLSLSGFHASLYFHVSASVRFKHKISVEGRKFMAVQTVIGPGGLWMSEFSFTASQESL